MAGTYADPLYQPYSPTTAVPAPPGQYWSTPNSLSEIPQPAIGTAAGQTANAYTTAAAPGLAGLLNGTSGSGSLSPLSSLTSAAGLGGAGTTGVSGVVGGSGGGSSSPTAANIGPIDNSAAMSAAFSNAKSTAGQQGTASLTSLKNALAAEGLSGSGEEAQGTRDVIENAAGQVGAVNQQNAVTQANQALSIAQANQNAAITQRGQDIQQQEAASQLALSQAQLQSSNSLNMLKLALGASSAAGALY